MHNFSFVVHSTGAVIPFFRKLSCRFYPKILRLWLTVH